MTTTIYPRLLSAQKSPDFNNELDVTFSLFHSQGNVTGAYVCAVPYGIIPKSWSSQTESLKSFLETNTPNLLMTSPVIQYDQRELTITIDTAFTGIFPGANIDIDTEQNVYEVCVLAVGFDVIQNKEVFSIHFALESQKPSFVSSSTVSNDTFVEPGSVIAIFDGTDSITVSATVKNVSGTDEYAYVFAVTGGETPISLNQQLAYVTDASAYTSAIVQEITTSSTVSMNSTLANVIDSTTNTVVPISKINSVHVYVIGSNKGDVADVATGLYNSVSDYLPVTVPEETIVSDACVSFTSLATTNHFKHSKQWTLDTNWSCTFWTQLTTTVSQDRSLFNWGETDAHRTLKLQSNGHMVFSVGSAGTNIVSWTSPGLDQTDQWYHVGLVHESTSVSLYVNNVLVDGSSKTITSTALPTTTVNFTIGKSNMINTRLDDMAFFDQIMGLSDIETIFKQGVENVVKNSTPLYAFWKFDQDGFGNDRSNNNFHLTKMGANPDTGIVSETTGLQTEAYTAFVHNPYVNVFDVADPTEQNLTIVDASLFSSHADIEKYYVFAFATGTDDGSANVSSDLLTGANVSTFVSNYLDGNLSEGYNSMAYSPASGNVVMYSSDSVSQYSVKDLLNITLQSAFNTLTPSGAATDISNVTVGWTFTPFIIAVDIATRYGLNVLMGPPFYMMTVQTFNNNGTHFWYTSSSYVTMNDDTRIYMGSTSFAGKMMHSNFRNTGSQDWKGTGYGRYVAGHRTAASAPWDGGDGDDGGFFIFDPAVKGFTAKTGASHGNGSIRSYIVRKHNKPGVPQEWIDSIGSGTYTLNPANNTGSNNITLSELYPRYPALMNNWSIVQPVVDLGSSTHDSTISVTFY